MGEPRKDVAPGAPIWNEAAQQPEEWQDMASIHGNRESAPLVQAAVMRDFRLTRT